MCTAAGTTGTSVCASAGVCAAVVHCQAVHVFVFDPRRRHGAGVCCRVDACVVALCARTGQPSPLLSLPRHRIACITFIFVFASLRCPLLALDGLCGVVSMVGTLHNSTTARYLRRGRCCVWCPVFPLHLLSSCRSYCTTQMCGNVFCAPCSSAEAVLEVLGSLSPQRVCVDCNHLMAPSQHQYRQLQGTHCRSRWTLGTPMRC